MNSARAGLRGVLLVCGLLLTSVSVQADLSRLAEWPPEHSPESYPAEPSVLLAELGDYRRNGQHVDAVYRAMYAPAQHDGAIVRWVLAQMPMLPTPYYFLLSRKAFSDEPEEAVFWHMIAGIHALHDAARCAGDGEDVQYLFSVNHQAVAWKEIMRQRGELGPQLGRAVQWLRSYDGLLPPSYLCAEPGAMAEAAQMREEAIDRLSTMAEQNAIPVASGTFQHLVRQVMESRQDLLLTRLGLENLPQGESGGHSMLLNWSASVSDELLQEYLALSYLRFWDEPVARAALAYHASEAGQKQVRNAIDRRLGLGVQSDSLSAEERSTLEQMMQRPELQRMTHTRKAVLSYQETLLRMAAGDPRP